MKRIGQSLGKIVERADDLQQIRKNDLQCGDLLIVATQNSTYHVRVLDDGLYQVSGGWFDRRGMSPIRLRITGCSWGSSVIKLDIVAACGLCLEFSNRLITSPIKNYCIIPFGLNQ